MTLLLPLFIVLPLFAACLAGAFFWLKKPGAELLTNLVAAALFAAAVGLYFFRPFNTLMIYDLSGWLPPGGSHLILDGLSHLHILVANFVAWLVALYSVAYMRKYTNRTGYYALLLLLVTGINGVILTGDFFTLFIFLEIAALSAYALVAFGNRRAEIEAAFKYLILGETASLFILIGIGLVYATTGTYDMAKVSQSFPADASAVKAAILVLFLAGFGMKAALVPFHAWLPDTHASAPSPISALLSGVIIKTLGVYALIRILYNVFGMTGQLSLVLMVLSGVTIILGGLLSIGQNDIKRLMAYSSISQIGIIVAGLSLGSPLGIMGGIFHSFNHALIKPMMFFNAGAIYRATGTRDIRKMGGLFFRLPVVSASSIVGSLAISGLPPFNGFWSKMFVIVAAAQTGNLFLAMVIAIGSILTLASYLIFLTGAIFGRPNGEVNERTPWLIALPIVILAGCCFAVGLFVPFISQYLLNPAVVSVFNGTGYGKLMGGN
ncbi:hypothetical protein A3K48_05035 [candidate division WOR-1 bacterium RIFOXYA12_FULL_52_29]|uniref:NADH:quinone oxidoreductase/Mrp antiporter membrane subunit domain-containing protein n=1 Tax=candidate division WOR-1 bacterium RIFOXYC12_FULL_54_18 TaxID=1802584 RepID=A0A1F4T6X7_UNCSA|nr:MAG: hypothetical protein A3K44_05035 [candidate division WOR-1 bacterium RIFOXYA2_FULL_51_19]OGC17910.1 MAG: hypothetical protein A3K48_05035 [candidate division WOR-1 bacterium RIFOXYA12_FULL_52_29]OGC26766.1 MAG: hypothetical protein A3K32_05030 [candidate division WOR-1 bacterium RIFOXYB2_FULL_45_9]OGC28327.1 MAG: hypothetical protein A3K49_05035 [candidate division WOR-1 bacterium RIFOXYC12_FULL_54_18]OGC31217.1 MAG: hypothetical protein A2346_07585 [candidate division WOR-1 bacterium R